MRLNDDVSVLKGVGPKKKTALNRCGIYTLEDLIWHFPSRYEDRRTVRRISKDLVGQDVLISGKVVSRRYNGNPYKRNVPISFLIQDDHGTIEIVYFNAKYMAGALKLNSDYVFFGRIAENRGKLQMIHPTACKKDSIDDVRGVFPVYPGISGISQNELRNYQKQIGPLIEEIDEWLPEEIIRENKIADCKFAIKNIHFPDESRNVLMAKYRFIFEELLILQTGLLYMKQGIHTGDIGVKIDVSGAYKFIDSLSFEFTEGQKKVWKEISLDLESNKVMNRLVQGDVGSGKTVIAETVIFSAFESGFQSAMMAPTEILAKQHFSSLKNDFEKFGIKVGLLAGSMKLSEKKAVLSKLKSGEIDVIVGTHALIQPNVEFKRLGVVITDEQHRFGVEQRYKLSVKGERPNVLVMTATPIPRTLAVILYGELDISVIDTMPAGRKKIKTIACTEKQRRSVYEKIGDEIESGHQVYVVTPLIEDSEAIEAKSAEMLYKELKELYKSHRVEMLHGNLGHEEKDSIMRDFAKGDIKVLVATVVIEIGINVQNATVMVIENCERFGLAQMHQLRGRVGRGSDLSYCYLILSKETEVARQRVQIMCESSDGFDIAEEDLKLRGPGEIFGTRQHGLPEMHIADIIRHKDVLEKSKKIAAEILHSDALLNSEENRELRRRVEKMFGEDINLKL